MKPSSFQFALSIINSRFGDGYASIYFENDELKEGFHLLSSDSAVLIYSAVELHPKFYAHSKNALVLNVAAVQKNLQNTGKASALLNGFHEQFSGHYDILIPLWYYEGSMNLQHWIQKKEGRLLASFNEYWKKESIEMAYECLHCGAPPCLCRMDLYLLPRK